MRAAILFFLFTLAGSADKSKVSTKEHALRYLGNDSNVVRVAVANSYFWRFRESPDGKYNEIITVFKVLESYNGGLATGTLLCCQHGRSKETHLQKGDEFVFATSTPVNQVLYLDIGDLVPVAEISKRFR